MSQSPHEHEHDDDHPPPEPAAAPEIEAHDFAASSDGVADKPWPSPHDMPLRMAGVASPSAVTSPGEGVGTLSPTGANDPADRVFPIRR